jgi:hypothetical protein
MRASLIQPGGLESYRRKEGVPFGIENVIAPTISFCTYIGRSIHSTALGIHQNFKTGERQVSLTFFFSFNITAPSIGMMDDEPAFDEGIIIIVSSKKKKSFHHRVTRSVSLVSIWCR